MLVSHSMVLEKFRADTYCPSVDPATSIAFPKTLRVPANIPIPPLTLVGLGVRTVSFINIKVYSVGLYADLDDPNLHVSFRRSSPQETSDHLLLQVPRDLTPEDKIKHIINNTACVVRIGEWNLGMQTTYSSLLQFQLGPLVTPTYGTPSRVL